MMSDHPARATIDDLRHAPGQAELIGGRIIRFLPSGRWPSRIAGRIARRLDDHAQAIGVGEVFTATLAFTVPELPSGRESFSPDVSYFNGPLPANKMSFIKGPPTFAVEVRSENDYGDAAEADMVAKRDDYFQAGTQVVWDVDPLGETIRCYRAGVPVTEFHRGDMADAEPAVPGWRMSVDEVFG
jgi:Uma2 family endonuclease